MDLYIYFHHFYSHRVNECVQKTGEDVITKVINKPIKYKVNIPVCRYETVPGEPYTYTVNKPKIEYRKMCYDVPQPKCSQNSSKILKKLNLPEILFITSLAAKTAKRIAWVLVGKDRQIET